jgi:hypothetical protein
LARCKNLLELSLDAKLPNVAEIAKNFPAGLRHLSISSTVTGSQSDYNFIGLFLVFFVH